MKKEPGSGTHIIMDLEWCENEDALAEFYFKKELLNIIKDNGMKPIKTIKKSFKEKKWHIKGYSYTAIIMLEESHVSLHTFPFESEKKKVAIDIYTCNFSRNNRKGTEKIAKFLIELFNPINIKNHMIITR